MPYEVLVSPLGTLRMRSGMSGGIADANEHDRDKIGALRTTLIASLLSAVFFSSSF